MVEDPCGSFAVTAATAAGVGRGCMYIGGDQGVEGAARTGNGNYTQADTPRVTLQMTSPGSLSTMSEIHQLVASSWRFHH